MGVPEFAEKLTQLREAAGFENPPQLARWVAYLGYRRPNYSDIRRYELGLTEPTISSFAALVDALGLTDGEIKKLIRASNPRPKRSRRHHASEPGTDLPPAPVPG